MSGHGKPAQHQEKSHEDRLSSATIDLSRSINDRHCTSGISPASMTIILSAIARTVLSVTGAEFAKHVLLLAAACAFVFVLSLTYGLDLSLGFF